MTDFEGYNLRGLIVTYLEEQAGWRWDGDTETWRHPHGKVEFTGWDATDKAIQYQIEQEEHRADDYALGSYLRSKQERV